MTENAQRVCASANGSTSALSMTGPNSAATARFTSADATVSASGVNIIVTPRDMLKENDNVVYDVIDVAGEDDSCTSKRV